MALILVACPTCETKAYALGMWLESFQSFEHPEKAAFMVDNTPGTLKYTHQLRDCGVPTVHVEPMTAFWDTMEVCWRVIVERAHDLGAEWVASIEADVVCPPPTLDVLLAHGGGVARVSHNYPDRRDPQVLVDSLGCALLETRALYASRDLWLDSFENFAWALRPYRELRGLLDIEHMDG